MNPKERFDACIKVAEFWSGRGDSRRPYEWRMFLTFCAFMVAMIIYLPRNLVSGFFVSSLWAGFILLFLRGNWTAATKDKVQAWHYADAAMEIISNPNYEVPKFNKAKTFKEKLRWRDFFEDWSQEVQMGIAFLFGLAFWLIPQLARLPQSN